MQFHQLTAGFNKIIQMGGKDFYTKRSAGVGDGGGGAELIIISMMLASEDRKQCF